MRWMTVCLLAGIALPALGATGSARPPGPAAAAGLDREVTVGPPEDLAQYDEPQLRPTLAQARALIGIPLVRQQFSGITGRGLTIAVLDTGLRATHRDFRLDGTLPADPGNTRV